MNKTKRKDNVEVGKITYDMLNMDTCECNEVLKIAKGNPCSSKEMISVAKSFVEHRATDPEKIPEPNNHKGLLPTGSDEASKIINQAASLVGCHSESCVMSYPDISNKISKSSMDLRFKAKGPRDTASLLSNFNLDDTLQQWADLFENFYPYPFTPIDFYNIDSELADVNIIDILVGEIDFKKGEEFIQRKCNQMACVVNTDLSTGPGKHWVCLFVDCKPKKDHEPWTIEYFNSAGNPPCKDVIRWMEETRKTLIGYKGDYGVESINVTKVTHQQDDSECGMYCLFYIRCRLEDHSYKAFMDKKITDNEMIAFRKYVFREY